MKGLLTASGAVRAWYAVLMVIAATFAAMGLSIGYTAYAIHRSDQQFCDVFRAMDGPLPSSPPPTQRQRDLAHKFHQLRVGKGC